MTTHLLGKSMILGIIALCVGASIGSAFSVQPLVTPRPVTRGNILYVGGNGSGNYTTIQAAIDNSTNGDTIYVYDGIYNQNIDTKLNKQITIHAEDQGATITGPTTANPVVSIRTSGVVLDGFTIIGTTNQIVVQVMSLLENVVISNNVIKNGGYGISLMITTSRTTISDNIIQNNAFVGIQVQTSTYNLINHNIVRNNPGQGISVALSSHHNTIVNNTILNNGKEGISIDGAKSTDNTITGNNISGNQVGLRLKSGGTNTIQSNIIQKSLMEGVLLQVSSENTITMNNFINNKRQAAFRLSSRNTWDSNYWSNWIGFKGSQPFLQKLPKAVHGLVLFTFDMHPMLAPYNITGFP